MRTADSVPFRRITRAHYGQGLTMAHYGQGLTMATIARAQNKGAWAIFLSMHEKQNEIEVKGDQPSELYNDCMSYD